jgi:chromosome segregation ATPase
VFLVLLSFHCPSFTPCSLSDPHAIGPLHGLDHHILTESQRIEEVTRENFDLKLKLHYFETRLAELAPGEVQAALAQNINLKVEAQGRAREVKKLKKRAGELERALDAARAELAQRRAPADGGVEEDLRAAEDEIAALHADLAEAREAAQEHADDAARVRAELAAGADADASMARAADEARSLRARARELEAALADADRRIAAAEDARDDAADEADALRGELELSERRRAAEGMERSESRAAVAEAHDAREATEDALADARDRLAALTIELQEREDELAARERDVDALRAEHDVIVADVEEDWRAEMGELRDQAEDLKDVRHFLLLSEGDSMNLTRLGRPSPSATTSARTCSCKWRSTEPRPQTCTPGSKPRWRASSSRRPSARRSSPKRTRRSSA